MVRFGVDLAREGKDRSVCLIREDNKVIDIYDWAREDLMQSAARLEQLYKRWMPDLMILDCDGVGAGCMDRLRELKYPVFAFHGNKKTDRKDSTGEFTFRNWRSWAYWNLYERLNVHHPNPIVIPASIPSRIDPGTNLIDILRGDLCSPKAFNRTGAVIEIEAKDEIKKRLKRSPDVSDAMAYCWFEEGDSEYEAGYRILTDRELGTKPAEEKEEFITLNEKDTAQLMWGGARNNHDTMRGYDW